MVDPCASKVHFVHREVDQVTPTQIEQCYKLVLKIRKYYVASGEGWNGAEKLDEMRHTENLEYILALDDRDKVVGFVSFVLDDVDLDDLPTTFIWEIHVDKKMQSQGLGNKLMKKVQDLSPESVTLRVFACNKRAGKFYSHLGYKLDEKNSDEDFHFMQLRN